MMTRSEKMTFENASGQELAARLELPQKAPRAFAIFAHCFTCSKDVAAASRISRALGAHGIGVLRFDFTGLGNSEGDFANTNFSSNVQDLCSAAEHIGQQFAPPRLLIGHSLGGAAVLAASIRIDSVEATCTIGAPSEPRHVLKHMQCSLDEIERDGEAEVTLAGRAFRIQRQFIEDVSEVRLLDTVRELNNPLLILHAPDDDVVDIDHARRIYAAANHPKSFVALGEADHLLTDRRDSQFAADLIAVWAGRYLGLERE